MTWNFLSAAIPLAFVFFTEKRKGGRESELREGGIDCARIKEWECECAENGVLEERGEREKVRGNVGKE